jgi:hypothetical protein
MVMSWAMAGTAKAAAAKALAPINPKAILFIHCLPGG